ncbi:hypothetical protein DPMN_076996 [Dreissena polymorpha]|uniref:Uncharacterized protein n=1 Tax=Dreissena polymorpha TaxID=45954 RepID=A0A9D3YK34_DREPO|nr:hypothetical protein DPMN_076996 [Dreissena polymorpha]
MNIQSYQRPHGTPPFLTTNLHFLPFSFASLHLPTSPPSLPLRQHPALYNLCYSPPLPSPPSLPPSSSLYICSAHFPSRLLLTPLSLTSPYLHPFPHHPLMHNYPFTPSLPSTFFLPYLSHLSPLPKSPPHASHPFLHSLLYLVNNVFVKVVCWHIKTEIRNVDTFSVLNATDPNHL